MRNEEHKLQANCIKWFRMQYPKLAKNLFAVGNQRQCNYKTANYYKKEGVTAGVSDCILAVNNNSIPIVFIEFKTIKGKQTETQKEFQNAMQNQGYAYWIIRDFEAFRSAIENYVSNKKSGELL